MSNSNTILHANIMSFPKASCDADIAILGFEAGEIVWITFIFNIVSLVFIGYTKSII